MLTTQNNNLLFEYATCNNNIFISLAEEVWNIQEKLKILVKNILKLIFLNFYAKQISSLEMLRNQKIQLYDETQGQINTNFDEYNERIDLFYNMFYKKLSDLPYENQTPGLLKIEFTIHPTYNIKFPLEILFKLINSNTEIPLIKYNPGRTRENIYRLFTDNQIATNGKNIPYLYSKNKNKKSK